MPELITETLLVVEPFTSGGMEYLRGDHIPVRHRAIRRIAREHPEFFRVEFAPEPVDLAWLDSLEDEAEERYQEVLRAREAEQARRENALQAELVEQTRPQPELERAYAKQQAEQRKQEERKGEERTRDDLEKRVALLGDNF